MLLPSALRSPWPMAAFLKKSATCWRVPASKRRWISPRRSWVLRLPIKSAPICFCAPAPPTQKVSVRGRFFLNEQRSAPSASDSVSRYLPMKIPFGSRLQIRAAKSSLMMVASGPPMFFFGRGKPVRKIRSSGTPYSFKRSTTRPLGAKYLMRDFFGSSGTQAREISASQATR